MEILPLDTLELKIFKKLLLGNILINNQRLFKSVSLNTKPIVDIRTLI
jgi:hypothetical protein